MIIVKGSPKGAECVFSHHIPATHLGVSEFTNYPDKYFCEEHANKVIKFLSHKGAK